MKNSRILGKLLNFFEPQLPVYKQALRTYFKGSLRDLNKTVCPEHGEVQHRSFPSPAMAAIVACFPESDLLTFSLTKTNTTQAA